LNPIILSILTPPQLIESTSGARVKVDGTVVRIIGTKTQVDLAEEKVREKIQQPLGRRGRGGSGNIDALQGLLTAQLRNANGLNIDGGRENQGCANQ
jgi:hypothetical protein